MIEMLGVLAIIGVLSAGGIMGYYAAMENVKANSFVSLVETVVSGVQNTFPNHKVRSEAYFTAEQLLTLGIIPSEYKRTTGNFVQGKYFTIYINGAFSGPAYTYTIDTGEKINISNRAGVYFSATKVSKSVCIKLMTQNWNLGEITLVRVDNTTPAILRTAPLSTTKATELCNLKENTIALLIFTHGKVIRNYTGS